MDTLSVLKDIGNRGNGDVYLGVVGPVRVGKSTFIRRFMETIVIDNIEDEKERQRALDELPQAGDGKTIMTMEPKFIPSNAINIKVEENLYVKIRVIDCVGFLIESANGYLEDSKMRMVKTPWFKDPIPFDDAAKIGTQKVIKDHSTLGIVVLSDGTINDFTRTDYLSAEEKVIEEMKSINKPFVIVLNTKTPGSSSTLATKEDLEKKYQVPVLVVDVLNMNKEEATEILKTALYQFPISSIQMQLPSWVSSLDDEHYLKLSIKESIDVSLKKAKIVKDVDLILECLKENEYLSDVTIQNVDTGTGLVTVLMTVKEEYYDSILKDLVGFEIEDKAQLIGVLSSYVKTKKEYDVISKALSMAESTGYGFSASNQDRLVIEKPIILKQGSRYGIKVKATCPTYHIIKVDVSASFEPVLGSKDQAEFFTKYLTDAYEKSPLEMLECEMFGRKFKDIINESISIKLHNLPEPVKLKLQQLIKTISNKGKGNLIAFVF